MGNYRDNNSGGRGGYGGGNRGYGGNRSFGGGNSDREMFSTTCASCGKECQVPFRPTGSRPVYCNDCFKKNAPQESGGRFQSRDNRRDNNRDREMFDAVCDNCGKNCRVPFSPREGKETLCSDCFAQKGGDPRSSSNQSKLSLDEVNAKLDKILELLSSGSKVAKKEKVKEAKKEVNEEIESVPSVEMVITPPDAEVVVEKVKPAKKTKTKATKTPKKV